MTSELAEVWTARVNELLMWFQLGLMSPWRNSEGLQLEMMVTDYRDRQLSHWERVSSSIFKMATKDTD